jgi:nifR3 family TIM-barrel protein
MVKNFWQNLEKPILALAPMAGITDSAWRQMCKKFGADVVYSEMASATAFCYNAEKTLALLKFSQPERPYVVQLFGSQPEHFARAVKIIGKEIKPDGIDINFGCPVKKVQRQGAGAVLMKDLKLAREIIETVLKSTKLPVSIKVRSRVGQVDIIKFLKYLRGLDIKAIMIHGRDLNQGHSGAVDWVIIKKSRQYFPGLILANGGVVDKLSAAELLAKTEADGLGIGQGALGRPWIFEQLRIMNYELRIRDIFKIALAHARLVQKLKGKQGIVEMRKHLCWYVQGLPGAKELRSRLIRVEKISEIKNIFTSYIKNHGSRNSRENKNC